MPVQRKAERALAKLIRAGDREPLEKALKEFVRIDPSTASAERVQRGIADLSVATEKALRTARDVRNLEAQVGKARQILPKVQFEENRNELLAEIEEAAEAADAAQALAALRATVREVQKRESRYPQLIERVFLSRYQPGSEEVLFERVHLAEAASALGLTLPKNLGDVIYSVRYRAPMPASIRATAPPGQEWIILPNGRAKYRFTTVDRDLATITPRAGLARTKIPDATPGIIEKYALTDEQALLAKLRYNRLVDIFTGLTCYPLQSHLRTAIKGIGQVETDEIYVGVDRRGAHYIIPVQAKGGTDTLGIVQIWQDLQVCKNKPEFASLISRPIAAQFLVDRAIALFEFEETAASNIGIAIGEEKHYTLVPHTEVTQHDLEIYASLTSRISPP